MQKEVLAVLAEAHDFESYCQKMGAAREVLACYLEQAGDGKATPEELVISKRLTRQPQDYQKASLTAIAAQQLCGCGVELRPGQTVEYIITNANAVLPNDRARAWTLWEGWRGYDTRKYCEMLREAFGLFLIPMREAVCAISTAKETSLDPLDGRNSVERAVDGTLVARS
jgi:DNA polymerase-2